MHSSILLALWAGVAFVIFQIVSSVLEGMRHRRNAKRLGCEPAYSMVQPLDYFGFKLVYDLLRAVSAYRLPQYYKARFDVVSEKEGRPVTTISQVCFIREAKREM